METTRNCNVNEPNGNVNNVHTGINFKINFTRIVTLPFYTS